MRTVLVIQPVVMRAWEAGDGQELVRYLDRVKGPTTVVETVAITLGPASIETFYDEALALPGILRAVEQHGADCDAVVINCFADPGIVAVRQIVEVPVVGAAEASMALALQLGHRFAVVSTGESAGPWIELQARAMGVESRLAGAVGIAIPVLGLGTDPDETARALILAANDLIETKGANVIVLGCTGMAPVAEVVRTALPVPVVEPMAAALKTA